MITQKKLLLLATLAVSTFALNGCGSGTQIVKSLEFKAEQDNGDLVAGFDAKVTLGQGSLPDAKLPIYNPNSPAQFLGYIETNPDGTLSVRVDVTTAAKVQVTDGTLLPNGREIPIVLPAGVTPIAIPVINSNSKVYLAVGSQNIMAGVAVTLIADAGSSSTDWIRILQSLPANLFYPFNLATDLKGTAGVFTGDKVGVGVFAVKTLGGASPIAPKVTLASFGGEASVNSLAAVNGNKPLPSTPEVFGVKTQYPTGSRMNRIQGALRKVRHTQLD
ncbi:MAG: hypothetical protein JST04_11330 [Bdellovibrionales bacterium]|nr:hypothetical protein [Bdellovibrionales bacterium]